MEDFESRALSPELLNINSNPRLKFHSPVASVYSDLSEDVHQGWSPPPWRKHGTGWYAHQSGLKSPPRSREVTPLLEEHEQEDEDEAELRRAARIALPESPLKGRSEEPSLSPAVRTTQTKTDYMTPPNSQETATATEEDTRWNNSDNCTCRDQANACMTVTDKTDRHSLLSARRCPTSDRTHRGHGWLFPQDIQVAHQITLLDLCLANDRPLRHHPRPRSVPRTSTTTSTRSRQSSWFGKKLGTPHVLQRKWTPPSRPTG